MKILANNIFLFAIVLSFAALLIGCQPATQEGEVEKLFDQHTSADLVFFYTKTSTYEQRNEFYENVLNLSQGGGYWPRSGVKTTWGVANRGYDGFAINFNSTATPDEKLAVKEVLQKNPIVVRVYENHVVGEITDLP